jgi:hypothetical protein
MSISNLEPLAEKVSFDSNLMWVTLVDGRKLGVPLAYFPRLMDASAKQRSNHIISGGGRGLHWESLDEDISVRGLFFGRVDNTKHINEKKKAA